jgi:hydroxymethylglutaryl-CoA lyase
VLGCPYEGEVNPKQVADVSRQLWDMGCYEISLGDTIGTGTPAKTQRLFETVGKHIPMDKLAGHFHDTYGQALANILAALELGVAIFDSSIAGLGGCPYAKGATGNVASEDVLYMLQGMGIETGVDMGRLLDTAEFICAALDRPTVSRAGRALAAKRRKAA